jgi:cob(I)alamin adenosyltransferase
VSLGQAYQQMPAEYESVSSEQLSGATKYVNRLSDLLFTIGRVLNKRAGDAEIMWSSHRTQA